MCILDALPNAHGAFIEWMQSIRDLNVPVIYVHYLRNKKKYMILYAKLNHVVNLSLFFFPKNI